MIDPLTYFLVMLKASLFSTGGFSNLPSLRQDMIARGWAGEADFGRAIAIGQISPGPNGLWVIGLGYFTDGFRGAALALVAITLPPLLVLLIAPRFDRIERYPWARGAMRGVSFAVVSLLISVIWTIARQPGVDWRGLLISLAAFGLAYSQKINIVLILTLAGIAGYVLYR